MSHLQPNLHDAYAQTLMLKAPYASIVRAHSIDLKGERETCRRVCMRGERERASERESESESEREGERERERETCKRVLMESIGNKTATAVPRAAPPAADRREAFIHMEGEKNTTAVPRAALPAAVMQQSSQISRTQMMLRAEALLLCTTY